MRYRVVTQKEYDDVFTDVAALSDAFVCALLEET